MKKPYEGILICSDYDGTLSTDGQIADNNREAILDFCQKGGMFTVSSGRDHQFLEKKAGGLFNAPLICVNGTRIYDAKSGQVLFSQAMDEHCLDTVKSFMPDSCTGVEVILEGEHSHGFFAPGALDMSAYEGKPVSKIVTMYATIEDTLAAKEELCRRFPQYEFGRSFTVGVEQISPLAGKGECVSFLRRHLGVRLVIAVGDFENDLSMFAAADLAFAPQNAIAEVKEKANGILCTASEGTLADLIRKLPSILDANL